MEISAPKGAFSFLDFNISEFSFKELGEIGEYNVDFEVSGKFYPSSQKYELIVKTKIFTSNKETPDKPAKTFIKIVAKAYFKLDCSFVSDIKPFFYTNSLAIVYPYLRSYVSIVTTNANNGKFIILPVLNLSGYSETLKRKTKVID